MSTISRQSSSWLQSDEARTAETGSPIGVQGPYLVRLASSEADRLAAFRLRFQVFNLELDEGLNGSRSTGHDIDRFDSVCDHLIVEHAGSGQVVGTYRLQTGMIAAANLGYYGEREFDFMPLRETARLHYRTGACLCAPRSPIRRRVEPVVAGHRPICFMPPWSLSSRLFVVDLARSGTWQRRLSNFAETHSGT